MDELKLLIEMVADLPQMALWVLIGFFIYKCVVIGSIYGVLRLLINRLHSWLTTPREKLIQSKKMIDDIVCLVDPDDVINELRRVSPSGTVHPHHLRWIREAISEKKSRESAAEREMEEARNV